MVGAVSPDLAGDLDALASTIPGVTLTPGGISVLGLDPGQNRTTLNGMSFVKALDGESDLKNTNKLSFAAKTFEICHLISVKP